MGCGANDIQQQGNLTEVLEHIANVALLERVALTNLTQANLTLAKQLEKAQEEIEALKKKNTKKEPSNINNFVPGIHTAHYCWSHSITVNANHTRHSCTQPKAGHKKEATLTNMMGGETKLNIPVTKANRKL
eukprot:8871560-Ditylum_brightwellii.AAC.1